MEVIKNAVRLASVRATIQLQVSETWSRSAAARLHYQNCGL